MSKDFIVSVILHCASSVEFINKSDKKIRLSYDDLLKDVEQTLKLLAITIDNTTIE